MKLLSVANLSFNRQRFAWMFVQLNFSTLPLLRTHTLYAYQYLRVFACRRIYYIGQTVYLNMISAQQLQSLNIHCKCTPLIKCATKCKIVAATISQIHPHTPTHTHTDIDIRKYNLLIRKRKLRSNHVDITERKNDRKMYFSIMLWCCAVLYNNVVHSFCWNFLLFLRLILAVYCSVLSVYIYIVCLIFITLRKCPIVTYRRTASTHTA